MQANTLFNYSTQRIGEKTYLMAQRWRDGFTVPEGVIVREVVDDEPEGMAS